MHLLLNIQELSKVQLLIGFRIKKIQNCVEYIKNSSEKIKDIFIPGDTGCRHRSVCPHGQAYTIDGKEYWKCGGCCKGMITLKPRSEDITGYIKLVELGKK